jgi:hypothetical protein
LFRDNSCAKGKSLTTFAVARVCDPKKEKNIPFTPMQATLLYAVANFHLGKHFTHGTLRLSRFTRRFEMLK